MVRPTVSVLHEIFLLNLICFSISVLAEDFVACNYLIAFGFVIDSAMTSPHILLRSALSAVNEINIV